MRRFLIQLINGCYLILVIVGVPSITSRQFGRLQVSSVPDWQSLTLWGLCLGVAGNLAAAILLAKSGKGRRLWLAWTTVYFLLLSVEFSLFAGYIHFRWLEQFLRWITGQSG